MIWLTPEQISGIRSWMIKHSPKMLLILAVLILGFTIGYSIKGSEITRDCKYANAFRVGVDSFSCARKI